MSDGGQRPIQASIRAHGDDGAAAGIQGELREALAQWASGVAVLAASDGDEIESITVTAVSALSMEPPLVLVCVHQHAPLLGLLLEERRFTLSLLAAAQRHSAVVIAQRMPGYAGLFHSPADPAVKGALVALTCRLWEDYPGGDHRILVGEVERVSFGGEDPPLLYFRRGYRGLA
jgi:flavin reductase (NADH)